MKNSLLALSLLALLVVGEKVCAQKGYILLDSTYSAGIVENQGKKLNTQEVKFRKSPLSPVTVYNPSTVTEYGFNDKIYRSKKILTGNDSAFYFLFVLSKGSSNLYTANVDGKKRFFAEHGNSFVELKKENGSYRDQITDVFETCDDYKENLSYLRFKEKSLKRFFTLQNSCYNKGPWPMIRLSGVAGFAVTKLTVTNVYGEELELEEDKTPFFGLGVELPLGTHPAWFITIQSLYQQNSYQKSVSLREQFEIRQSDYEINVSSLTFPLQVKYCIPVNKIKGYISLGPSVTYNLKNETKMVEKISTPGNTTTNEDSSNIVNTSSVNANAALGLEYYINPKISISLQGNYFTGQGFGSDGHSISSKQLQLAVNF